MYLIDTSVLTRLARPVVAAALLALEDVSVPPIAALEYRFSASNPSEWDTMNAVLAGFGASPFPPEAFDRAAQVQRLLTERGLKGRKPPDLLIAAHAELTGKIVVHYDRDYDHIASVTGQPTLWIAAPGTID